MKKLALLGALLLALVLAAASPASATCPTPYSGNTSGTTMDAQLGVLNDLCANSLGRAGAATYNVTETGYTAYATPTDLVCLSGSATKTVAVTAMHINIRSTAGALQTIYYIKRSTANTGGTSTTPTPVARDSASAAATAVVRTYTVAPTTGTAVGTLMINEALSVVLTAAPVINGISQLNGMPTASTVNFDSPTILRGVAQSLCINYNGAALTGGFTATYGVQWVEW